MRLLAGLGLLCPPAIVALILGSQSGVFGTLGVAPLDATVTALAGVAASAPLR